MISKKTDIIELSEEILRALQKATRKLVEAKAAKNENLVIGDTKGKIEIIPAKKLLHLIKNYY